MILKWDSFIEILNVFKQPYEATNMLQNSSFTLSDFYLCWLKIIHKLKGQSKQTQRTDLAELLLFNLMDRKAALVENTAMLCAVFLDARVKIDLNANQKYLAKLNLKKLYTKIQESKTPESGPADLNSASDAAGKDDPKSKEDSFNKYMESMAADNNGSNVPNTEAAACVELEIDVNHLLGEYEQAASANFDLKKPILEYWEERKDEMPVIYELACIINCIPPTQAAVERSFSMLNFIYTCRRYSLGDIILQAILTVKLNESLLRQVNKLDLEQAASEETNTIVEPVA